MLADRRGSVAVEFAAIALPLLLLLFGSVEISRFIWTRHALQDAATAGARCLGLRTAPCFDAGEMDAAAATGLVQAQAAEWAVSLPAASVVPEGEGVCGSAAGFARVRIVHRFAAVVPVLPEMSVDVEACFPVMPTE
jgi:Flp pilus assembly protein TadG